jgi:hypothetical protein
LLLPAPFSKSLHRFRFSDSAGMIRGIPFLVFLAAPFLKVHFFQMNKQ